MKALINILLKYTWKSSLGTKLKYRIKKLNYQCAPVSWSIAIYETTEDFLVKKWKKCFSFFWFSIPKNTNSNQVSGCADPFLIVQNDSLFLFYEAIVNKKGEIWCTEMVNNQMKNSQKVICESFHLSYPNVFKYQQDYYMIPESSEDKTVCIYKSTEFPIKWELYKILKKGSRFVDTNFIAHENTFFWFTFDLDLQLTRLFYSDSLFSEWIEHKQSPINSNRNAGDFICSKNDVFRPVQISKNHYGEGVELFKIIELSKDIYIEKQCITPFLTKEKGYNLDGTHHISLVTFQNKTIIAVDGKNNNFYRLYNRIKN